MSDRYPRYSALAALVLAAALGACDSPVAGGRDRAPPTLTLYSPTEAGVVETDTVVVQGLAEDDEGVRRVAYRLNGGAEQEVEIQPSRSVFFKVVLRDLKLGANQLEVLTYDAAAHTGTQRVGFSTRDVTLPAVEVRSIRNGDLVGRDSVWIAGVARDGIQVASVAYTLDGGAEQAVQITPGKQAGFGFTLKDVTPGEHTLVVRARDGAGNAAAQTLRFSVASVAMEVTSPARDTTIHRFALYVRGRIEHDFPLSELTVSLNGGEEAVLCRSQRLSSCDLETAGSHTFEGTVDGLSNGQATVTLYAYDRQGRKVGMATRVLTISVPVKQYTLAFLGTLGGSDSEGTDLNESGQVVGWSLTTSGAKQAFAWDGTRMLDLGALLGASESRAVALSRGGEVVGTYRTGCPRAFRYRIGQTGSAGPLLDGCDYSPSDVNDAGKVLVYHPGGPAVGGDVFVLEGSTLRPLQAGSWILMAGLRINNQDRILGAVHSQYLIAQPALLSPTAPPQVIDQFYPTDMNDAGHITFPISGPTSVSGGQKHAYVVTDRRRDIESLGVHLAQPQALNNRDQVVGTYVHTVRWTTPSTPTSGSRAFFWENGTTYSVEVTDPAWSVDDVVEINDAGVILAHARNTKTGQTGAVLLTPKG